MNLLKGLICLRGNLEPDAHFGGGGGKKRELW